MRRNMDPAELERIAEEIRPLQQELDRIRERLGSDPRASQELANAFFAYNEKVDAYMPRIAKATGMTPAEARERFSPKDDYHAFFDGASSDYLANVARYRTLEPPDWVVNKNARLAAASEERIPRPENELMERERLEERERPDDRARYDYADMAPSPG